MKPEDCYRGMLVNHGRENSVYKVNRVGTIILDVESVATGATRNLAIRECRPSARQFLNKASAPAPADTFRGLPQLGGVLDPEREDNLRCSVDKLRELDPSNGEATHYAVNYCYERYHRVVNGRVAFWTTRPDLPGYWSEYPDAQRGYEIVAGAIVLRTPPTRAAYVPTVEDYRKGLANTYLKHNARAAKLQRQISNLQREQVTLNSRTIAKVNRANALITARQPVPPITQAVYYATRGL